MSRSQARPYVLEEDLLREIAREVVAHVAPHELVLFHAESTAYLRDPRKALKAARKRAAAAPKNERFGFGGGELIVIATPIVLAMVETALVTVGAHLALTATERSAGSVRALVRRMRRRPDPAEREEPTEGENSAEASVTPAAGADIDSADGPETDAVDGTARPAEPDEALPPAVREAIRQKVYEQALRYGIDVDGARLLADAVIGSLTT
ncbi:hypothetical protein ABZY83_26350 [Streptomyces virginiae]|uniref:hypothetical protein n=1 Tax=Streptomyces TaxID=1883 RepID=UPI00131EBB0E|nr:MULTISPECIES: hypothetical protein [unclassified Streptomyces]